MVCMHYVCIVVYYVTILVSDYGERRLFHNPMGHINCMGHMNDEHTGVITNLTKLQNFNNNPEEMCMTNYVIPVL
jgi:hypothetical protein